MDSTGQIEQEKKQMKCREMERLMDADVTGLEWVKKRRVDGKKDIMD